MASEQQVVEGGDQCLMHAGLLEKRYHTVSDEGEEAASDCSTVSGNQGLPTSHSDGSLGDVCSDSANQVESLIIFDWDDTLFPTTWLQQHDYFDKGVALSNAKEARLESMANRARVTLQMALQVAKVVIVTNAEQGWVQSSCKKFMPSLVSLVKTIEIVSARTTYEGVTKDMTEWKRMAFQEEVELFYGPDQDGQQRNIVSLGDSMHEMRALKSVTDGIPNCWGKSIKFWDYPSIQQLIDQHDLLVTTLLDVVEDNGHVDVEIGEYESV